MQRCSCCSPALLYCLCQVLLQAGFDLFVRERLDLRQDASRSLALGMLVRPQCCSGCRAGMHPFGSCSAVSVLPGLVPHASLYNSTTKTGRYCHISPKMFSTCCVAERQGTNCHMHCCCIITVCAIRFDLLSIFAVSHACISHSSVACVIWKVDIPGLSFLSRSGRGRAGPPRRVIQSDQDPHLASCSKRAACSCCLHVCGGLAMQL